MRNDIETIWRAPMAAMVRLEWWRYPDGFDIVERPEGYGGKLREVGLLGRHSWGSGVYEKLLKGPRLWLEARKPTAVERYVIEGTDKRVFLELANIPPTPAGAQAFTNQWGLLTSWGLRETWTRVDIIHARAKTLNEGIRHTKSQPNKPPPGYTEQSFSIRLNLRRGKLTGDITPRVFLQADTLEEFCWAEFMQLLDSGVEIRRCPRCGSLLALGTVGQPAIYCSNACRIAMHRRHRKERDQRAAKVVSAQRRSRPS
jgi:hypothetical protein